MKYKYIGKVECDECGHEFDLNTIDVQTTKIELNNTIVDLVYFVCPKCEKIYRISIQDARYYDLKEDLEKARKRIKRNRGNMNIAMAEMLCKMVDKKHERLARHVEIVNEMFPGTFTFEVSRDNPKEKIIKYLP